MTVLLAIGTGLCSLRVPAPADGGMSSNAVGMLLRLPDAPPTFRQKNRWKLNGKIYKSTKYIGNCRNIYKTTVFA